MLIDPWGEILAVLSEQEGVVSGTIDPIRLSEVRQALPALILLSSVIGAVIAGLIQRHHPGVEKNRKQVTVNSDLIYDVLRKHQGDHVLLRAARAEYQAMGKVIGH